MQENYKPLWKTCMAHDPNQDGFLPIETLKTILCQFIMPLSEAMFKQLVDRCVPERSDFDLCALEFHSSFNTRPAREQILPSSLSPKLLQ